MSRKSKQLSCVVTTPQKMLLTLMDNLIWTQNIYIFIAYWRFLPSAKHIFALYMCSSGALGQAALCAPGSSRWQRKIAKAKKKKKYENRIVKQLPALSLFPVRVFKAVDQVDFLKPFASTDREREREQSGSWQAPNPEASLDGGWGSNAGPS